jgi:hypothetical protein
MNIIIAERVVVNEIHTSGVTRTSKENAPGSSRCLGGFKKFLHLLLNGASKTEFSGGNKVK